jgi:hypothetical protein
MTISWEYVSLLLSFLTAAGAVVSAVCLMKIAGVRLRAREDRQQIANQAPSSRKA